jgi:hypothetical protein
MTITIEIDSAVIFRERRRFGILKKDLLIAIFTFERNVCCPTLSFLQNINR